MVEKILTPKSPAAYPYPKEGMSAGDPYRNICVLDMERSCGFKAGSLLFGSYSFSIFLLIINNKKLINVNSK